MGSSGGGGPDDVQSGSFGGSMGAPVAPVAPPNPASETAWERGLRIAKEMKEKALKRKQQEKDFNEKKMNLSLKELEDEKENDERHMNIERFIYYLKFI